MKFTLIWKKTIKVLLLALVIVFFYNISTLISLTRPMISRVANKDVALTTEVGSLYFPALGIKVPVKSMLNSSPIKVEDWPEIKKQLTEGAAYAMVGDIPTVTAHSADSYPHAYSSVFAGLGQSRVGDKFVLNMSGENIIYQVSDVLEINPSYAEEYFSKNKENMDIALVTCWPPLTTKNRLLVLGILTK